MHVVGNAVMKQNSFNNVIINGMVLAEDGKKMSKKLKNYPEPQTLFENIDLMHIECICFLLLQ
jgi:isoleucyl-tRNA synthetase